MSDRWKQFRAHASRSWRTAKTEMSTWPDRSHAWLQDRGGQAPDFFLFRFRLFTVIVGLVIGTVVLFSTWNRVLDFVDPKSPDQKTNLIASAAQIAGGAILLFGLFFTARTYLVNREGQITDRFSRAIDHLGSESFPVRLGGVYALERIARDSPRDQRQIVEILTAFVRETAPVSVERLQAWSELEREGTADVSLIGPWREDEGKIKPDVQAVLTVLGRRDKSADRGEPIALDLWKTDLRGASWNEAYLQNSVLIQCDLEGAWIKGADLKGASLNGANLFGTTFAGSNLQDAWIQDVFGVRTYFTHATLKGANFYGSVFRGASFSDSDLSLNVFHGCNLDHADFYRTNLYGVRFEDSSFEDASFTDANLAHAHLRGADLSTCRGLTQEQIDEADIDAATKLPRGLELRIKE